MTSVWKRSIVAAALAVSLTGVACDITGNRDDSSGKTGTLDRETGIPRNAKVVAEDEEKVSFKARDDGRIYLYDVTDKSLRHNTNLRSGDVYVADGDKDQITLNGERVVKTSLVKAHKYRLYYLVDTRSDYRDDRDRRDDRSRDDSRARVPNSAQVVASGRNLTYRASDDGTAYLYDSNDDRLVDTFNLERGQNLSISADGRAMLDGRTIKRDLDVSSRHNYKLLFDRH
jgi:hypothetical protein